MMRDMRIGVIGGGMVGQATARTYLEHVKEVIVWDVIPLRCSNTLHHLLNVADPIFVCLPTPQRENGMGLDCSALDHFFSGTTSALMKNEKIRAKNFVLRSTVSIGTTRRLREQYGLTNLVHSPEFLTARCAVTDAQMPTRNIIGVPAYQHFHCPWLQDMYLARFPQVPCLMMSSDESEAVKLFQNGVFAATVSLWNELRSLADKLRLDWDTVRNAILADGRISPSHTQVPGPDGRRGWGGACLGKDLSQLLSHFYEAQMPANVLDGAWHRNFETDRPVEKLTISVREVKP